MTPKDSPDPLLASLGTSRSFWARSAPRHCWNYILSLTRNKIHHPISGPVPLKGHWRKDTSSSGTRASIRQGISLHHHHRPRARFSEDRSLLSPAIYTLDLPELKLLRRFIETVRNKSLTTTQYEHPYTIFQVSWLQFTVDAALAALYRTPVASCLKVEGLKTATLRTTSDQRKRKAWS